jgi:hypothetical protein
MLVANPLRWFCHDTAQLLLSYVSNYEAGDSNAETKVGIIYRLVQHVNAIKHVREIFLQVKLCLVVFGRLGPLFARFVKSRIKI